MVRGIILSIILLIICGFCVSGLVESDKQPTCDRTCSQPDMASKGLPVRCHGKIRPPADLSIGLARPADVGKPVTLVIFMSSQVPIESGVLSLHVPRVNYDPNRTEVLWLGMPADFVARTVQYTVGPLPVGRHHFAAVFEFTPDGETAGEMTLSDSLYLDVRPTEILASNVSFDQIKRIELRRELEHRIAMSLMSGLTIASEDAADRELARLEAADPGFTDRMIEELKASDPDVARRIMELNEYQAEERKADSAGPSDAADAPMEARVKPMANQVLFEKAVPVRHK